MKFDRCHNDPSKLNKLKQNTRVKEKNRRESVVIKVSNSQFIQSAKYFHVLIVKLT